MNSPKTIYNLSGIKDPTDKQLTDLMKSVAKEAEKKSIKAHHDYFKLIDNYAEITLKNWESRIKCITDHKTIIETTKDKTSVRKTKKI